MNCDGLDLPPIIEPEVNVIYDSLSQSAKLEALSPRALERELENENTLATRSVASVVAAHMGINLFLTILTFSLIFTVLMYRRRLNRIRNDLYYGQYSTNAAPSNGSSSNYYPDSSVYSHARSISKMHNRARMPLPAESNKNANLSFSAATRNILRLEGAGFDMQKSEPRERVDKLLCNSKVESHLMSSRRDSQKNVYSDFSESILSDEPYKVIEYLDYLDTKRTQLNIIPEDKTCLTVNTTQTPLTQQDSEYQVPRSPALRSQNSTPTILRQVALDEQSLNSYSNDDQLNLYEEIKPKTPGQEL